MQRKPSELQANALNFWPTEIARLERNSSIIPKLIETQDKFISLLDIADSDPFAWKQVLQSSQLPHNLFLKHLLVLSDIGGEKLMRFKTTLPTYFEQNQFPFHWNNADYVYTFKSLNSKGQWNNDSLKVDGVGLTGQFPLTSAMEDVINLVLFGGLSTIENIPEDLTDKCMIGNLIGHKTELENFVKQRYIWVSRITGGATANSLGNLAQQYVQRFLQERLPRWDFGKKRIPGISQNERTAISFDLVAKSPGENYCAIEISFQVTTNSVIERKAGQAQSRQAQLHNVGHKIAYIIDGAGNFQRSSALRTICEHSDCTVTFKESELIRLSDFLISLDQE